MAKRPLTHEPWAPAEHDVPLVAALKALGRGEASPDQQKRALDWIVNEAAGTYDMTFHPEDDRATAFAEGKRHVGRQIVGFMNISMEAYKASLAKQESPNGRRK